MQIAQGATNLIENYLWIIARYMPGREVKISWGSVIRFGRIPFKISKLKMPKRGILAAIEERRAFNSLDMSEQSVVMD